MSQTKKPDTTAEKPPVTLQTPTIPHKDLPLEIPPAWTVDQLLHHIPIGWRCAAIAIEDGLGRAFPVKRVMLVQNHDGSAVVILSTQPQKMCKWQ